MGRSGCVVHASVQLLAGACRIRQVDKRQVMVTVWLRTLLNGSLLLGRRLVDVLAGCGVRVGGLGEQRREAVG